MSFVDNKGARIQNNWFYRLGTPNPWGSDLLGQVVWGGDNAYYFIPYAPEERKVMYQIRLEFAPLIEAPKVRQCKALVKQKLAPKDWRNPYIRMERHPKVRRQ